VSTDKFKNQFEQGRTLEFFIALLLLTGLIWGIYNLTNDLGLTGESSFERESSLLLVLAFGLALCFESVNGFHDTSNAVATVIYTNSLKPRSAVLVSGLFNWLGALLSNGSVAYGIVALLPLDLVIQSNQQVGLAIVFSILTAAISWNLGTWSLGIPASSTHTLIGSILGVGIAQALLQGQSLLSGIDLHQAALIGYCLLFTPFVGFSLAAIFFHVFAFVWRDPRLFEQATSESPPPWKIRALLVLTCSGVSFAHGSNDGQKGMGLIMLMFAILAPTTFALNPSLSRAEFNILKASVSAVALDGHEVAGCGQSLSGSSHDNSTPVSGLPAIYCLADGLQQRLNAFDSISEVPAADIADLRKDLLRLKDSIQQMPEDIFLGLNPAESASLIDLENHIDTATRFIPIWVKVCVAIALGFGSMIGWKRVVVTVGERIGRRHLTYGQGAAAEFVTMLTIMSADHLELPASTTHVLCSGIAGTMVANNSGLMMSTVRNLLIAWGLTLPSTAVISAITFGLLQS
jgi:PiT family inorganic phosphate transporter